MRPSLLRIILSEKNNAQLLTSQTNATQLVDVDNAPHEYSQLTRTMSLSQQTVNEIATDAAAERIKRTMSHASAPQQANMSFNYRAADVPEHYKSHGDIRGEMLYSESLLADPGKGPLLLNFMQILFIDFNISVADIIFIDFNCGASKFIKYKQKLSRTGRLCAGNFYNTYSERLLWLLIIFIRHFHFSGCYLEYTFFFSE